MGTVRGMRKEELGMKRERREGKGERQRQVVRETETQREKHRRRDSRFNQSVCRKILSQNRLS